jgi:predicted transcriptional regulator
MNKVKREERNERDNDLGLKELVAIKKLLALLLLKIGTKQDEIGMALQMDRSTISKWFKGLVIQKINIKK